MRREMENEEIGGNTLKKHIKKHLKHKVEDREIADKKSVQEKQRK